MPLNMGLRHLANGSTCPALKEGLLRCYNMKYCPYAQRTLLVLNAKKVKFEIVNINLKSKPDWFLKKNPIGKVPVLENGSNIIYESLVTSEFLDEMYPNPPLYPKDPWSKARDKGLIAFLDAKVINNLHRSYYKASDIEAVKLSLDEMQQGLDLLESELISRGTEFFGGEAPAMLDYAFWPWCERFPMVTYLLGVDIITDYRFPRLTKYIESLGSDSAVCATRIPLEEHLKFMMSFLDGNPNYDLSFEEGYDANDVASKMNPKL